MKLKNKLAVWTSALVITALFNSCGIYSFTGSSLPANIKTMSIQTFFDNSGQGPAGMAQRFTETLRDYFQQNTRLTMVSTDGDLQMDGSVTGYRVTPIAPTASGNADIADEAGLQRLTITVSINYVNTLDETLNFKKSFTFYDDFNPRSETLSSAEPRMIETIFDQIAFDIFNASVANW